MNEHREREGGREIGSGDSEIEREGRGSAITCEGWAVKLTMKAEL